MAQLLPNHFFKATVVPKYSEASGTILRLLRAQKCSKIGNPFCPTHRDFYFELLQYLQKCTFPLLASCSSPKTPSLHDFLDMSGFKAPLCAEYVPLVLFLKAVPDNPFYQGTLK